MGNASNRGWFEHPALLYGSVEEFLSYMVPYVETGLENGDVVFVAARGDNVAALRAEMGPRGTGARWADTDRWHPHPGTRLRAFHELVSDEMADGATRFRLAGEPVWPSGPPEAVREWQRYESVLNRVLAPFPVTLVCLYDAARLDPSVVASARRTHPVVRENSTEQPSEMFAEPEELLARWNPALSPPPPSAAVMSGSVDLASARRFLLDQALRAGVEPWRARDLCVAANEAMTNALVHGDGVAFFQVWEEGDRFLCQVDDVGPGIGDPLAGYRSPSAEGASGRGLWLARQLVDLLQVVPGPTGTSVRLQTARAPRRARLARGA